MKLLFQFYKALNLLSLDVAVGAMISALFFARILTVSIFPADIVCLGLTVWMIYTVDHLFDARRIKGTASTERHRFHQDHFGVLLPLLALAAAGDLGLAFFIRTSVFQWGIYLAGVSFSIS